MPFEVLVERLNPTRSLTHHPLIQVMLAWQNIADGSTAELGAWVICRSPRCRSTPTPPGWIWRSPWPNASAEAGEPAGIGGAVEFRTDVFDAATIEALIERLERVLVAMTADPARRLSSIDLLDAAEHARLDAVG